MFHILDDDEWAESVKALASFVRFPGQLIITDHNEGSRKELGDYIVHRAPRGRI